MGVQTDLNKGSRLTGFLEMHASLDALKLLFEPLQLNSNASGASMDHKREKESFWVFSVDQVRRCFDEGEHGVMSVYDNPVYNVTNGITLTHETFTILLDNLYIEEVFKHEVGRNRYMAYSQAIPEGASIDELVFVVFFMTSLEPLEWFGEYILASREDMKRKIVYSSMFMIVTTFILAYLIVICITRKIIRSIIKLRSISIDMK